MEFCRNLIMVALGITMMLFASAYAEPKQEEINEDVAYDDKLASKVLDMKVKNQGRYLHFLLNVHTDEKDRFKLKSIMIILFRLITI